ncbi:MAG: glutamyl-tRNA synthetase [Patescibacteria group bacterium]|nr:glutamyl-tRNA synthetase [Patescibacteria group bacterium]
MNKVRVRFAPSPTGFLHVGGLRTALYDYLYARKTGGDFVLKIEDTDRKRFVEGAVENLIKSLDFLGLERDEGVFMKDVASEFENEKIVDSKNYPGIIEVGEYGPYIQSEKLEVYKKYAEQLVKDGHAYYCFCEPERLEEMRKEQQARKSPPLYDQYCLRNVTPEEVNKKLKENCLYTIRLKIPKDETIEFEDMVRGKVKFDTNLVDDQVLLKSDGFPTYHLANVVDDHDMKITYIIRGEEWLSSAPKHLLLYRYFGWEAPRFAHLPLLLNTDRSKLSKRQGDVAVEDYIKKGYLKEAIINFVAFLGWNPGGGETQEIFTLEELADRFDFAHVHKGGAVFDLKKLDWINSQWIKRISLEELYSRSLEFWKEKEFYKEWIARYETRNMKHEAQEAENYIKKVLEVERERLQKLSEVGESNRFFFAEKLNYDKKLLSWKDMPDEELRQSLARSAEIMENIPKGDWTRENLEKELMAACEKYYKTQDGKINRGSLLWPLRAALTGEQKSPSPFEVAWVLGKEESLKRINKATELK